MAKDRQGFQYTSDAERRIAELEGSFSELAEVAGRATDDVEDRDEEIIELKKQLALENARADALHGDFVKMRDLYDALQWQPITPENLPKEGDEVAGHDKMSVFMDGSFRNILHAVSGATAKNNAGDWKRLGYYHFRPINPPAQTPEADHVL